MFWYDRPQRTSFATIGGYSNVPRYTNIQSLFFHILPQFMVLYDDAEIPAREKQFMSPMRTLYVYCLQMKRQNLVVCQPYVDQGPPLILKLCESKTNLHANLA